MSRTYQGMTGIFTIQLCPLVSYLAKTGSRAAAYSCMVCALHSGASPRGRVGADLQPLLGPCLDPALSTHMEHF